MHHFNVKLRPTVYLILPTRNMTHPKLYATFEIKKAFVIFLLYGHALPLRTDEFVGRENALIFVFSNEENRIAKDYQS